VEVMQHHIIACGDASIAQVLVRWSSLPDSLVTWENIIL